MKKGMVLFLIGWVIFMLGIYLSMRWVVIGTFLGVTGGAMMGGSTYFLAKDER